MENVKEFLGELLEYNLGLVVFIGSMSYFLSWLSIEDTLLKSSEVKLAIDVLFIVFMMVSLLWVSSISDEPTKLQKVSISVYSIIGVLLLTYLGFTVGIRIEKVFGL